MKKFSILLAAIFMCSFGFGQWSAGPRLGLNLSTCSGKYADWDDSKKKWIPGLVVGGVGEYAFTDMISLDAELLFITSGAKYIYSYEDKASANDSEEETIIERYGSFQIPVLAKFTFGEDCQFYANAGPYFTFTICGKYINKTFDFKEKLEKDYYKTFDMGLYLGGGVQRELGPGKLAFDIRFGLGFLDTYQFPEGEEKPDGYKPYKNRNISLTFAYMFGFGNN
jgi:hypothetical protein